MGFEQIVGQDMLVRALKRSLRSGEISHAYLFAGPPGSGKKTLAFLFAQALNCTGQNPPCGQCLSCRKMRSGNHPNLFYVKPQGSSIKIEQLRELKEKLFYLSTEGFKKICILYDADSLTLPAGNSILKILEEPPKDLVFLLLSSRPQALLQTILSRCIRFFLRPLTDQEMAVLLESKKPLPPQERELLISLAEGNPGRALQMLTRGSWQEKLEEAVELLRRMECSSEAELLPLAEELSRRDDLQEIIAAFVLVFRQRLHCFINGVTESVLLKMFKPLNKIDGSCAGAGSETKIFPGKSSLLRFEKTCRALLQLQSELQGNVNRRLALEVFLLTMRGVV